MKRKELLQRDDDDGDSMLSSATSDTSSTKRKRWALFHIVTLCSYLFLCMEVEWQLTCILFPVTRRIQRKTEWKLSLLLWLKREKLGLVGDCVTCSWSSPRRKTIPTTTRSSWNQWTSGPLSTTSAQTSTWLKMQWWRIWSWCSAMLDTTMKKDPRYDLFGLCVHLSFMVIKNSHFCSLAFLRPRKVLKSTFVSCCKEESLYDSVLKWIDRLRWKSECSQRLQLNLSEIYPERNFIPAAPGD